jgi:hypothetical protein
MPITNYTELQQAIVDWTHRADLAAKAPDFIRLAEDVIYTDLDARAQDEFVTLTTVANQETVTLPSNFMSMKSVAIGSSTPHSTVDYRAPDQYRQEFQDDSTGVPRIYTIVGGLIYLRPIPDQAYTLNVFQEARIPALSASNTTNWLLTQSPMVYLAASMIQALIYVQDEAGIGKWTAAYKQGIDGVNTNAWANGNTLQVKTDVNLTGYSNR